MEFEPILKELVSDKIIQKIKDGIDSGQFKAGDRLPPEMEMAMIFRVGRSSVREALKVLIHLGILERHGRHTVIAHDPFDKQALLQVLARYRNHQAIADMIEVRRLLETQACEFAAERADETDIRELQSCVLQMKKGVHQIPLFIEADQKFHFVLANATKNKVLIHIMEGIRRSVEETVELIIRHRPEIVTKSLAYHEKIYQAIARRQPRKAQKCMKEHLEDIELEFKALIRQK